MVPTGKIKFGLKSEFNLTVISLLVNKFENNLSVICIETTVLLL